MKKYSTEDLLLFLDVILTGEEFAEYSAEEREAMFRAIRDRLSALPLSVTIQRGEDGYWLCLNGKRHKGAVHLDEAGGIVQKAIEECCTEDVRSKSVKSRLTERQRENEIKEALRQATKCMAGMLPLVGDKKIQDLYRQALDGLESVLFKGIRADDVKEADHD